MFSPSRQRRLLLPAKICGSARSRGMTLLEMTVVILVLLLLATLLVVGARAWKNGSDRTMCILNMQNVQKGLRSYANLYGYDVGRTVTGLQDKVIGENSFVAQLPVCPHRGVYGFEGDVIPPIGTLYMTCSLSTSDDHMPKAYAEW